MRQLAADTSAALQAPSIPFDRVRSWLMECAWPFWAESGVDRVDGGFVEFLDLNGVDGAASYKRVRAHARQIYCFSHAALLGFEPGRRISDHGWAFLQQHGRRGQGGWGRTMGRRGGLLDESADAYDLAFVLFAHAWRYRLTSEPELIESALATVDALEELRPANNLGWLAASDDRGPRQQNPHMHLIEAAIELADATGHPHFVKFGQTIADLFTTRIIDRDSGALREYFGPSWERLDHAQGRVVEPGHQLEWAWILYRANEILKVDLRQDARALYAFAMRHGLDPVTGLTYDQVDVDGVPLVRDSRSWPQTEALKAHIAMLEHEGIDTRDEIAAVTENIFRYYLDPAPTGTWLDHRHHDGRPKADKIPSTTLYHIQLAFTELLRVEPLVADRAT